MPEDAWTLDSGHLAAYWKCNHREREEWPGRGENGGVMTWPRPREEKKTGRDSERLQERNDRGSCSGECCASRRPKQERDKKKEALKSFWSFFVSRHPRNLESGRSERLV